ncbi:MAG: uracil-DNA glycosylase family protein [Anaerolineae bacterium]|nr:uracil-DNA glycosylase family protein [Anaerolineae bacterium]
MMNLNHLHEEMRACRRCLEAGYDIAPGAIFSPGSENRRVMLIGQAPGVTEVDARRPFNAGSGRRLFQWLGEAGWDEGAFRGRHYMTAVTKCYPGKSGNGKGDRVPSKAEQALCRPFLEQEIALVNPRLILLVGGLAIKLFYPAAVRLEEIVGTAAYFPPEVLAHPVNFDLAQAKWPVPFTESKEERGRWVVPLPHPSGASLWPNQPANQALIQQAIALLRQLRLALEL